MSKSEKISEQFNTALNYLALAESTLHKIRELEIAEHDELNRDFVALCDKIEDLQMQVVCPMQDEEIMRDEEIRVLERRLAELKSMQ
jgi:hypothetical protein